MGTMAKVDWEEHRRRHREEYPELTVPAYAREFGLNPDSARRNMRSVKGEAGGKSVAAKSPATAPQKSDRFSESDRSGKDKSDRQRKVATIKKNAKISTASEGARVAAGKAATQKSDRFSESDRQKSDRSAKNDRQKSDRSAEGDRQATSGAGGEKVVKSKRYRRGAAVAGEGAPRTDEQPAEQIPEVENTKSDRFSPPNYRNGEVVACMEPLTAQDHTGGYVSYLNMDDDILEAAIALSSDDGDLTLASGRYLQLFRCKEKARKKAIEDYRDGQKWCYPGTETEMPLEMAVMQTETAPAQRLAELERIIGTRKAALWRQAQVERELHPYTKRERLNFTTEILQKRRVNGWSALETAQELEMMGLSLPDSLKMEVAREVGFIEPITDTDGGISDAELEEQSRAYMAGQKEVMGNWLPHRREEVAAALAAEVAHQNGDLVDEEDFDPLDHVDVPPPDWGDDDDEPLTPVTEEWE